MVHEEADDEPDIDSAAAEATMKACFPATSFDFDPSSFDTSNTPITNVVIPLSKLLEFIHSSFACKVCKSPKHKKITVERYGIASSLYFECSKCNKNSQSCRATLTADLEQKWSEKPKSKKFKDAKKDPVNASDFDLNPKLYLATQQCGGGAQEAKVMAGILGLHTDVLHGRWGSIAETVGLKIIETGEEILEENINIEMQLSPYDEEEEKRKLSTCGDCRWDKRSSGRRYDSMSGCTCMIGCRSQLVLDIAAMSNYCIKCARKIEHEPELCPKNVECSSKGMEAIGSAKIVGELFDNYEAYICEYVGDDDASTKKVLRHSWADEVRAGIRLEKDIPRNKDGKKKPDNGLLPIEHPEIIWQADKGHRVRQFANKLFKLSGMKVEESQCNSMDAERLKRNMSYAIRTTCASKDLSVMKKAVESVLEHHFNNHSLCGDWCRLKKLAGDELEQEKLKYRCKEKNKQFYLQVKKIFEDFYLQLDEMLHEWDTNIVEGMNKFFTKFLPKDRTYAMTIENKVRLYLAVSIDSVGYLETYRRIGAKTGLTICEVHKTMSLQFDNRKSYRRMYRKTTKAKIARMRKQYQKLNVGKTKLAKDNRKGLSYSTGQCGPFAEDQVQNESELTKKRKRKKTLDERMKEQCVHCKVWGHTRRNSSDCLENPKMKQKAREEKERESEGARKSGKCATFDLLCTHMIVLVLTSAYVLHEMESYQTKPMTSLKILTIRPPKKPRFLKS
jgi:hypothetical protein